MEKPTFTVQPYYYGNNRPLYLNEVKDYYSPFVDLTIRPVIKTSNVKFDYHTSYSDKAPNAAKFRQNHPTKGEDIIVVFVDKENWGASILFYGVQYGAGLHDDRVICFVTAQDHEKYGLNATHDTLLHELRHALIELSDKDLRDDTHDLVKEKAWNERVDYLKNLDLFYNISNGPLYPPEKTMKVDKAKLAQIYNELLMRDPDPKAEDYIGMEEEQVRSMVGRSAERAKLVRLVNVARGVK